MLASCKAAHALDSSIPSDSELVDEQSYSDIAIENDDINAQSDSGTSEINVEDVQKDFEISPDIEIVRPMGDRIFYYNLQEVEEKSDLIVKAVVKGTLGQKVFTLYNADLQKDLPTFGYTKREIEITQVYKGDTNVGDKLVLSEDYYIWKNPDGKKQLVCFTSVKPAVKEKEYLLFLSYHKDLGAYYAVGDYQGIFDIPTDKIKTKGRIASLEELDQDRYYDGESLSYLLDVYNEVLDKYFN
jgi:hypothetical protein